MCYACTYSITANKQSALVLTVQGGPTVSSPANNVEGNTIRAKAREPFTHFKPQSKTFDLSPLHIDEASEWLHENQLKLNMEKSDRIRSRLMFEEALLKMADHYGSEQRVTAFLEKRLGRYRIRLLTRGDRYNPLRGSQFDTDEWSSEFFSTLGVRAQYSYGMGTNVLRIPMPKKTRNPVLRIIIALLVGVVGGALSNIIVPDSIQIVVTNTILNPIASMWVRLLQAISGPIIFFTALTSALGTKRLSDFGGSRFITLARYFVISLIGVLFTLLFCYPFFPVVIGDLGTNSETVGQAFNAILQIIPNNLLEPFSSANTPQLLLIAIVTGYALAALGDEASELKKVLQQANLLGLGIAQKACALVPYFVGLLLFLKIWTHDVRLLEAVWLPLVLASVLSIIMVMVLIVVVSLHANMNPLLLARKLKGPFLQALKTGSLNYASVDDLVESCKNLLGIDEDFARAVLPQGLVLCMPTSAIGICVFVFFVAQMQHTDVTFLWVISAVALSVILAVATPPLNGANLLAFVVAFAYLGLSDDAFLTVMVFDILFSVLCIACDQAILQLETITQASRTGFLDEDVLCAPLPN